MVYLSEHLSKDIAHATEEARRDQIRRFEVLCYSNIVCAILCVECQHRNLSFARYTKMKAQNHKET